MYRSSAEAVIKGSAKYPDIKGIAQFEETQDGVAVSITIRGLPVTEGKCSHGIFAAHIHEGGSCTGNPQDLLADTGGHFNPQGCPHPFHAGDMPPLFAAGDKAAIAFLTNRFTVQEIIGKTIVIHSSADDFHSQPSGNSGEKIACGVIRITNSVV